jgi:hypothetical protein
MRGTLLPEALQFPVQAPVVFLLRRRDARDGPYPVLARVITHKHREQLVAVKSIRLRATGAPVHLDTGRIHHEIGNALLSQPAVQPEAVAASLITAVDGCVGAEVAARPGVRDGGENRRGITRGNRTPARRAVVITQ